MNHGTKLLHQDYLLKSSRQVPSEEILIGYTHERAIEGARAFQRANKGLRVHLYERASGREVVWKLQAIGRAA